MYNDDVSLSQKSGRDARMSFFSGHTSTVAAFSFFGAKVFSDYSDNTTHKALVWTGAVILPAVVGYLRVRAGRHFPTDVIAGYLVGGAIGYLVPYPQQSPWRCTLEKVFICIDEVALHHS